jgi:hypothetical protein
MVAARCRVAQYLTLEGTSETLFARTDPQERTLHDLHATFAPLSSPRRPAGLLMFFDTCHSHRRCLICDMSFAAEIGISA